MTGLRHASTSRRARLSVGAGALAISLAAGAAAGLALVRDQADDRLRNAVADLQRDQCDEIYASRQAMIGFVTAERDALIRRLGRENDLGERAYLGVRIKSSDALLATVRLPDCDRVERQIRNPGQQGRGSSPVVYAAFGPGGGALAALCLLPPIPPRRRRPL